MLTVVLGVALTVVVLQLDQRASTSNLSQTERAALGTGHVKVDEPGLRGEADQPPRTTWR
ncbi:MAG: hypothetical protein MZV64_42805 [Ignavibacteriales bacterium]|nr:hypothetical protein [Ignavibacteriales bacterium]